MVPHDNHFFRLLFESVPCGIIIANSKGQVRSLNPEGSRIFCVTPNSSNPQKGGDLFRCVNAGDGCGTANACETCILRSNAVKALHGNIVPRQKGKFFVYDAEGRINEFTFLVSAFPMVYCEEPVAVLIVEDVSLITELSGLIPICSCCHRIRDVNGEWVNFTKYLREHSEADLTHDYCPNCLEAQSISRRPHMRSAISE